MPSAALNIVAYINGGGAKFYYCLLVLLVTFPTTMYVSMNSPSSLQWRKNFEATQEKFNYIKILNQNCMPKVPITKLKENQRVEKRYLQYLIAKGYTLHFRQTVQIKYRCSIGICNS